MNRSGRGWVIVITVILLCFPVTVRGRAARDPYSVYMLRGGVDFRYTRHRSGPKSRTLENTQFVQRYSLLLTGNIWDPRFLIFDAKLSFDDTNRELGGRDDSSETWEYGLSTTLFPRFRFPLTLYADYSRNDTIASDGKVDERDSDRYGLEWDMGFRRLPVTHIKAERHETRQYDDGDLTGEDQEQLYSLVMRKDIGPTNNRFRYNLNLLEDELQRQERESSLLSFDSNAALPLNSHFNLSLARYDSTEKHEGRDTGNNSLFTLVGLTSRPLKSFSQNYTYSFIRSGFEDEETEDQQFTGDMKYTPSDRFNTSVRFDFHAGKTDSSSIKTESEDARITISTSYRLTERWSTYGSMDYNRSVREEGEPLTGRRKSEAIGASTGLNYRRRLSWATFSSGYGMGFKETSLEPGEGGKSVTQNFNAGLSNIDIRYGTLYMNYHRMSAKSYQGEVDSTSESYVFGANSKGIKFFTLSGSYYFTRVDTFENEKDEESSAVRVQASSSYIRNTSLNASADYKEERTPGIGDHETLTYQFRASHHRTFLFGMLSLSAHYDVTETKGTSVDDDVTSKVKRSSLKGIYTKVFSRKLSGEVKLAGITNDNDGYKETTISAALSAKYKLRAWSVNTGYDYSLTEADGRPEPYIVETFFVNLSRSFTLVFF